MAEKKNLTKFNEKRIFVFAGLTILILSVTVFRQTIFKTVDLRSKNKERREKLSVLTKKASFLEDLDKNQLEKQVRELEQVFPSKKPTLELLNALKSLAAEDGVNLGEFTLKPGKLEKEEGEIKKIEERQVESAKMKDFQVDFAVEGEFDKVSKFVKDLERVAPLMKIESLGISLRSAGDEKLSLLLSLGVRVYYEAPPKSIPSVETPIAYLNNKEQEILEELSVFKFYPLEFAPGVTQGKENLFANPLED